MAAGVSMGHGSADIGISQVFSLLSCRQALDYNSWCATRGVCGFQPCVLVACKGAVRALDCVIGGYCVLSSGCVVGVGVVGGVRQTPLFSWSQCCG
jgi:hypothetical protein